MKTKTIVTAVLTAAMAVSAIPFSASAEIMTEEEMRTTIEELAEENPDLDFSGLLSPIKPPHGYEEMEPNAALLELFNSYQVDDNIAAFLEKYTPTDKLGQLLSEFYLETWNEKMEGMKEVYGDDYIARLKYIPVYVGIVKLEDDTYRCCRLRNNWMGYEQVLCISSDIGPCYPEEMEDKNIISVEDFYNLGHDEAMVYALEYYKEHGDLGPFGVGESESSGISITTDWNGEKVGEKIEEVVAGDANCDGVMNMADAVLIMQNLSNPDKYPMYPQGRINADMDGNGMTNADALAIQKAILKLS